jgi:LmbE family N-acetylglucosaminyl deacetylase
VILTKVHAPGWSQAGIQAAEHQVKEVATAYRFDDCFWPGLPATLLDSRPMNEVIEPIRQAVEKVRPQQVYVVHGGDVHTDHQVVYQATTIVLKSFRMLPLGVRRLLSFECASSTEAVPATSPMAFTPNLYRDITPYIERKLEILGLYRTEAQPDPLPRGLSAVRALARFRGATIGVEYAEAFLTIRELEP